MRSESVRVDVVVVSVGRTGEVDVFVVVAGDVDDVIVVVCVCEECDGGDSFVSIAVIVAASSLSIVVSVARVVTTNAVV